VIECFAKDVVKRYIKMLVVATATRKFVIVVLKAQKELQK
jgi:hypothetical protein